MTARAGHDRRYRVIALSRNFGHQIAITSGLDAAAGEATIVLDADLQDPPELALALAAKWREGYDVVCAQRVSRDTLKRDVEVFVRNCHPVIQKLTYTTWQW